NLSVITQPVRKELELFQVAFKQVLRGHNPDFQSILDYIAETGGKRVRPIILLLSAKLCGTINQKTIDYAVVLELLHTATLIHDDVVDTTLERRSRPSLNARVDNRAAVLAGDYILSLAIVNGIRTNNRKVLHILGNLAQSLVDGELTQLVSVNTISLDENRYFEVIRKKTATLISACTELGAISVDTQHEQIETLREIGENIGICFQIRDDIFDYFEQGQIGKPTGNDIREGKITLPLLHALQNAPKEISGKMIHFIEKQELDAENIHQLIDFAKTYHGIDYAVSIMQSFKEKTIALLDRFPESEAKTAMLRLMDYIIERKS
ncbi:MAG: polyprenyl synthetase family protein, partial [Dysgonamonadaceae bacterium]|nr:polyprenyl synthetase family protein [Dysgonamonadaceae bacterium]